MVGAEGVADLVEEHDGGLVMPPRLERELALLGEQIAKRVRVQLALFEVCIPANDQVLPADAREPQLVEGRGAQRSVHRGGDSCLRA